MKEFLRRIFGKAEKRPESDRATEAELYNTVGLAAVENVGTDNVSVLLYVERVEGGLAHCLRYSQAESPHFSGVHIDGKLTAALRRLDEFVMEQPTDKRWAAMEYFIENGEIDVKFSYKPVNEDIPFWERTPAVVDKYFPGKTSDTASPRS